MTVELPDGARSILEEGRQAYIAVASKHGPHVTPELYAWSHGRLWFAAAASTLKRKVLGRDPRCGVAVAVPGHSVLLRGEVEILDPGDPRTMVQGAAQLPRAAKAMGRFTVRNAPDLLAFAGDTVRGRLGWRLPPRRAVFALAPSAVACVANDVVTAAVGDWATVDVPGESEPLPSGGEPAVIGLPGPLAVPGRWFADERRAHVPPGALALAGLDGGRFDVSVVVDEYTAPGPAAKQGVLVRGEGLLVDGEPGVIEVEEDRTVAWDGVETSAG